MHRFFVKSHERGASLVKGSHGFLMRLRQRPLHERRALFFATFAIASALVLSFWTNQMYRHFGIVFLGSPETPTVVSETVEAGSELSPENELKGPLAVARENVSILKENFINLFSSISSELKAVGADKILNQEASDGLASGKEPPLPTLGNASAPQNPPAQSRALKGDAAKEPPLRVSATPEVKVNSAISEDAGSGELKDEELPTPNAGGETKRKSRVVSITMTNLASIKQAFSDLYEYLTQ